MLRISSGGLDLLLVATLSATLGCSDPPPEPPPPPARSAEVGLEPLKWTAPGAWSLSESSPSGPRRAGYKVPKQGNDTEDAELLVLFFGTGANGERDKQWNEWFSQFDGDAKAEAKRDTFPTTAGATVETFEHVGTYKLNMGPQRPGMKKSPVQVVKNDFRMIGAVVKTKDRGNWFFRLVGPNETVLASKDAFKGMLESAQ
jgi:hypothetical protein